MNNDSNQKMNMLAVHNSKKICLITTVAAIIIASINLPYPEAYTLHQTGTLVFVSILLILTKFYTIRSSSWFWATGFVLLHILGARYIYSFVPYEEWFHYAFNFDIQAYFGWQRNMYDRLVHFSFGLCLFPFMYDASKSILNKLSIKQTIVIVLLINMSSSMLYELFEWILTLLMSNDNSEAYNGQQGDIWDAHKDMALALFGGLIGGVIALKNNKH